MSKSALSSELKRKLLIGAVLGVLLALGLCLPDFYEAGRAIWRHNYLPLGLYGLAGKELYRPIRDLFIAAAMFSVLAVIVPALLEALLSGRFAPLVRRAVGTAAVILILACATVFVLRREKTPDKPNIILIVVDTLRADHLGVYGYQRDTSPTIDKFARENTLYAFAQSAAPWTLPSVAGIISGFSPTVVGVFDLIGVNHEINHLAMRAQKGVVFEPEFATLAEILSNEGYETFSISANPLLREYLGFAQGYDHYEIRKSAMSAAEVNEVVYRYLNSGELGDRPFFLYLHYFDPHEQYLPPPEFDVYHDHPPGEFKYSGRALREINLYDGEIKYLDSQLAVLFEELKARNLYDDSVIVLTSDHGEQFMEHGRFRHGGSVFNQEIHVPLIIKSKKLGRARVEQTVSIIDIFATILDIVGIAPPEPTQSLSLLSQLDGRRFHGALVEGTLYTHEKAIVKADGMKARMTFKGENWAVAEVNQMEEMEIFQSRRDKLEKKTYDRPDLRTRMFNKFSREYQRAINMKKERAVQPTQIQEITVEQLKSLGYLK